MWELLIREPKICVSLFVMKLEKAFCEGDHC